MKFHLPAILMFTRGTRFWHTAISIKKTENSSADPRRPRLSWRIFHRPGCLVRCGWAAQIWQMQREGFGKMGIRWIWSEFLGFQLGCHEIWLEYNGIYWDFLWGYSGIKFTWFDGIELGIWYNRMWTKYKSTRTNPIFSQAPGLGEPWWIQYLLWCLVYFRSYV